MNQLIKKTLVCLFGAGLMSTQASAQLSSNPDKFLGNITTRYQWMPEEACQSTTNYGTR